MRSSVGELRLEPYESGRKGKPDRFEAGLAHLIGAYLLELDRDARFNVRVEGKYSKKDEKPALIISGEVSESLLTASLREPFTDIAIRYYNQIHQAQATADDFVFAYLLNPQATPLAANGHAGDSGRAMAFAFRGAPGFMPWERYLAVEIRQLIDQIYQKGGAVPLEIMMKSGVYRIDGLRADGKVDVGVLFNGHKLRALQDITLSLEHEQGLPLAELRENVSTVIAAYIGQLSETYNINLGNPRITVNPGGAWNDGDWRVDAGSAEAKPHEDFFGNRGNMEDAPWGEDGTKPSGVGTLLAWHIARWIVANELAETARVVLTYRIGTSDVGLNITTGGTGKHSQNRLEALVRDAIPLSLKKATDALQLRDPKTYQQIAHAMDWFIDPDYPWNITHLFRRSSSRLLPRLADRAIPRLR